MQKTGVCDRQEEQVPGGGGLNGTGSHTNHNNPRRRQTDSGRGSRHTSHICIKSNQAELVALIVVEETYRNYDEMGTLHCQNNDALRWGVLWTTKLWCSLKRTQNYQRLSSSRRKHVRISLYMLFLLGISAFLLFDFPAPLTAF